MGAIAVMLGAIGAHIIQKMVTPERLDVWKTGAHYHLVHAVALLALALYDKKQEYRATCWLWLVGMIIFSGTLYVLVLTEIKILGAITPIGGVCMIIGWILLGIKLLKSST